MKSNVAGSESGEGNVVRSSQRGRPTKFTPENIRQIINLVERGKSRQEIAEIIGVTPATLQVTCSKLGISLRRPRFNTGTGLLSSRRSPPGEQAGVRSSQGQSTHPAETGNVPDLRREGQVPPMNDQVVAMPRRPGREALGGMEPALFSIRMSYKGGERTSELPLTAEMVARLAFEAEFRGLKMADLLTQTLGAVIERDLFSSMLDQESRRTEPSVVPALHDED
jgi:hypothetical protein